LEEYFVGDANTLDDLERIDCKKAIRFANKIGRITRKLNDSGHYFIDNRASNWLVNRGLIRTDLEFFVSKKKNRKFSMFCDVLSFVSSVENEEVAGSFMSGYGKKIKPPFLFELFANLYIKITDVIF
jgi:tRNA A-37 threonylcarbamoyl transferase component Bud32